MTTTRAQLEHAAAALSAQLGVTVTVDYLQPGDAARPYQVLLEGKPWLVGLHYRYTAGEAAAMLYAALETLRVFRGPLGLLGRYLLDWEVAALAATGGEAAWERADESLERLANLAR